MTFDDLRQSWKQAPEPPSAARLGSLESVRAASVKFRRALFWRDFREVGAAIAVAGIFAWIAQDTPPLVAASALLIGCLTLGVALFILIDRHVLRRRLKQFPTTPEGKIQRAIAETGHQIWLLRNVGWWYIAPPSVGIAPWITALSLESPLPWWIIPALMIPVALAVSIWIWRLNQKTVADTLLPQRAALLKLLHEWRDGSN